MGRPAAYFSAMQKRNGHKYGAVPTEVDGIRFASKAEARRYGELKLLEKAGKISDLELQPRFELSVRRTLCAPVKLGHYVADFRYFDREAGQYVTEDVKGLKTPMYRWKKRHVEAQYGIAITEVR